VSPHFRKIQSKILIADAMSEVNIKCAESGNSTEVSDFICEHFNGLEPIQLSHVRKDDPMDPPPAVLIDEAIASQTLLLAYKGDTLVGVLIACDISTDLGEKDLELAKTFSPKGADVFEFLSYIGEKADICNRLKVSHCLHIHIISVHKEYLGQGIAKKLFQACVDIGEIKNYPAISVDCTSHFTSLIAEKFSLKCHSIMTYDEYNEHIGSQLFVASEPHTEIKTYAKLYAR
jgi:GNAT superfamily N-acetyltransferase